jgi:hypothetical protein
LLLETHGLHDGEQPWTISPSASSRPRGAPVLVGSRSILGLRTAYVRQFGLQNPARDTLNGPFGRSQTGESSLSAATCGLRGTRRWCPSESVDNAKRSSLESLTAAAPVNALDRPGRCRRVGMSGRGRRPAEQGVGGDTALVSIDVRSSRFVIADNNRAGR